MMKSGVVGAWVYEVRHAHLRNAPQPLKIGMFHNIEHEFGGNGNKAVDRIVYNFTLVSHGINFN